MDYKVKKLPKSEVEITITVPEKKMQEYRKKACDDISQEVKVKGFRPGHVPPNILEQHVDKKYIIAHTQEIAIQMTYAEVAIKEKIQVVSRPKVKIEKDEPFTFMATVATMPEVEVKDYDSIKIPQKEIKVTQKDIEAVKADMKKYATTYKDVDREAKKGDRVEVDFEGFDEKGSAVEGTKSQNHPVILGENTLIPGFEDQLIGIKKGGKKDFEITFPKDYRKKDFQGKKVKFKTEVKRVEEPTIPEINEEFVQKMTGQKISVKDFDADIEKNLRARKEIEARQQRENEYIEELLKKIKVEVPETLIDEEVYYMIQDVKDDIASKGFEFEEFLKQAKTNEEDLKKKYRSEAEKRIKMRLALRHVIEKEKIEVSEQEIKEEFERMLARYPAEKHAAIKKEFESGNLSAQFENKLALKKLFNKKI